MPTRAQLHIVQVPMAWLRKHELPHGVLVKHTMREGCVSTPSVWEGIESSQGSETAFETYLDGGVLLFRLSGLVSARRVGIFF